MAVTFESAARLTALKNKIDGVTGAGSSTLSEAVDNALAGYGSGGGGSTSGIYMAKITPETDSNNLEIKHNLGTVDILIAVCFAETLGDIVPTFNGCLGKFFAKTDIPFKANGAENGKYNNYNLNSNYNTTNAYAQGAGTAAKSYWDYVVDENTFIFNRTSSSSKFIAGVTYTVIIIADSAEV